jgi:hypothetical protein
MTTNRKSRLVHVGFAVVLAGVFLYFVANSSDRASNQLGSAMLCMMSWLILGPTWLLLYLVQRRRHRELAEQRGFEVKLHEEEATRQQTDAEESG